MTPETWQIKYGSEILDEAESFEDATLKAEMFMTSEGARIYVLDPGGNRLDYEDWVGDGIGWNDHLEGR